MSESTPVHLAIIKRTKYTYMNENSATATKNSTDQKYASDMSKDDMKKQEGMSEDMKNPAEKTPTTATGSAGSK